MDVQALFPGGDSAASLADPMDAGVFLRFGATKPAARHVFVVGALTNVHRWTACHRYEPFWMSAQAGTQIGSVPTETQSLLVEREDGLCVLLIPLIDGAFRCALQGAGEAGLELVGETGDPATVGADVTGLFVAAGPDPYALIEQSARSVAAWMKMGRLRRDKPLPAWADQFGWCTWDAFYQDVSHDKVRAGLESFVAGGVTPKLLILDDGWQSEHTLPSGERRLTAFAANGKFPGDLAPTVQMAKSEYGIEKFLVWHAMTGYWGGVDGVSLPGYGVRAVARDFSPTILHYGRGPLEYWGPVVGVVAPEQIARFFQDYHRHLRLQGVDGVKVDTQATLEGVAAGFGGRVSLMRHYREALEGSAHVHFQGSLINCMSCANEILYGALASNLTRTSTDFWPNSPESHGVHLYVNAQVSLWFGEFIHPDWDMFQSGHPMGAYHAAGRAVGGCPVYVSDKPDAHDFALLRKMVLPDGTVLRADGPGRPTRDCLFHDPTKEDVLLKIFNRNGDAGVIGVFNARYDKERTEPVPIVGTVSPADVPGLAGERFAVYAHQAGELRLMTHDARWEVALTPLGWEVFTIVPVLNGLAPVGLPDMFNSSGAIMAKGRNAAGQHEITLRAGGRFLAWCETAPTRAESGGETLAFSYEPSTHWLELEVPGNSTCVLRLALV